VISFKRNRHGFAGDSLLPQIAELRIPCLKTKSTNVEIPQQVVNWKPEVVTSLAAVGAHHVTLHN